MHVCVMYSTHSLPTTKQAYSGVGKFCVLRIWGSNDAISFIGDFVIVALKAVDKES